MCRRWFAALPCNTRGRPHYHYLNEELCRGYRIRFGREICANDEQRQITNTLMVFEELRERCGEGWLFRCPDCHQEWVIWGGELVEAELAGF